MSETIRPILTCIQCWNVLTLLFPRNTLLLSELSQPDERRTTQPVRRCEKQFDQSAYSTLFRVEISFPAFTELVRLSITKSISVNDLWGTGSKTRINRVMHLAEVGTVLVVITFPKFFWKVKIPLCFSVSPYWNTGGRWEIDRLF